MKAIKYNVNVFINFKNTWSSKGYKIAVGEYSFALDSCMMHLEGLNNKGFNHPVLSGYSNC